MTSSLFFDNILYQSVKHWKKCLMFKMKFDHVNDTRKHWTVLNHCHYFSKEVRFYVILVKISLQEQNCEFRKFLICLIILMTRWKLLTKHTLYFLGNIASLVWNQFLWNLSLSFWRKNLFFIRKSGFILHSSSQSSFYENYTIDFL